MWTQVDDTHWTYDDYLRHLLLLDDGRFAELHGQWMHIYTAGEGYDPAEPLMTATWESTTELADPITIDEQGWQVLTDALTQLEGG